MLFRGSGGGGSWVAVDVRALGPAAAGARVEAVSTAGGRHGLGREHHRVRGRVRPRSSTSAWAGPAPPAAGSRWWSPPLAGEAQALTVPLGGRRSLGL